ncbi:hypothetical protein CFC21_012273, partial [Triticum aestivum]
SVRWFLKRIRIMRISDASGLG